MFVCVCVYIYLFFYLFKIISGWNKSILTISVAKNMLKKD
jgi:hypothetical protein